MYSQNNWCFPYLVKFKSLRSCFGLSRNYDHVNKLTSVFHACAIIDHEFRHNIVKVAVDPRGNSRVDPQTTLSML